MKSEEICYLSACEMREKIISQDLTSTEITERLIERIEKIDPIINAYTTKTFDLARKMAKESDRKIREGEKLGLLEGVPTTIKELMYTKGIRTTFGSLIFKDFIPEEDTVAVARLKKEGIVMLGKTNSPEFGYAGVTHNKIFGVSKNPWKLDRTPGGSTGGGAAAVASGIGPLSLSSDGGGSIRHPACFCGVYGIKPTLGRVPTYPHFGMSFNLSHYGPIANYVKDAALMLDVMKGPHQGDQYSLPEDNISYYEKVEDKPTQLKMSLSIDLGYAKVIDPEVENVVRNSAFKLQEFEWDIEEVKTNLKPPKMAFNTLYTAQFAQNLGSYLKKWRDKMDPDFIKLIEAGLTFTGTGITKALKQRQQYYRKMYKFLKNYDILITPTTAIPAFELGKMFPQKINGIGVSPTGWQPFTFPFNLTGHPAATIPCGFSKEGLPIGMQIIGHRYDEVTVLQVSQAFEQLAPWQDKRPNFN
ncbi:MAG: amidase [Candidatus Lokiarchaeota archaeon]|nr:amidase [Candidatus Lokiarchaeota archaeon]MBD3341591.1 amidase [Candidatus Lokiarchaeota archaeon]